MEQLKPILKFIGVMICSFISPVGNIVKVLLYLWLSNFLCGLLAGLLRQGERWSFKKAFRCCVEAAVYVVIVASLFWIGIYLNNKPEVEYVVKTVTWVMVYFYCQNILRNLILLFPGNPVFRFLSYLLTLEFIKRIPSYQDFSKNKKNIRHENN